MGNLIQCSVFTPLAGVIGLAIARALAVEGRKEVLVLEAEQAFGTHTSSRHSEGGQQLCRPQCVAHQQARTPAVCSPAVRPLSCLQSFMRGCTTQRAA
jgi:hypothetical protein